jgi:hypothetical protein
MNSATAITSASSKLVLLIQNVEQDYATLQLASVLLVPQTSLVQLGMPASVMLCALKSTATMTLSVSLLKYVKSNMATA